MALNPVCKTESYGVLKKTNVRALPQTNGNGLSGDENWPFVSVCFITAQVTIMHGQCGEQNEMISMQDPFQLEICILEK